MAAASPPAASTRRSGSGTPRRSKRGGSEAGSVLGLFVPCGFVAGRAHRQLAGPADTHLNTRGLAAHPAVRRGRLLLVLPTLPQEQKRCVTVPDRESSE